jgi:hypothetical protein
LGLARSRFAASDRAARSWRRLHIASSGLWVTAVIHSLLAGTDTDTGAGDWARLIVCASIALVALAGGARSISARRAAAAVSATASIPLMPARQLTGASR